jgi:Tfp pilus assembly protein PilO
MKLNAKKLFIILASLNILLIGVTLAVFALASSIASQKSQQIAQLKADGQTDDQTLNYYKVLQGNLESNKDLQTVVNKVLPATKDQSAAFSDLDKFSKINNVILQQITFNPGTNKGSGQTLTSPSGIKGVSVIEVTMHCDNTRYTDLLNFLHTIENTQRRMQVTSLNITPNETNPDLLNRTDITLDIYLKS